MSHKKSVLLRRRVNSRAHKRHALGGVWVWSGFGGGWKRPGLIVVGLGGRLLGRGEYTEGTWIPHIKIPNTLGHRTFWSSDFQWFGFGMVNHSKSYSFGPDHSKTEPLGTIGNPNKMAAVLFRFPMVLDKMATILFWFPMVLDKMATILFFRAL